MAGKLYAWGYSAEGALGLPQEIADNPDGYVVPPVEVPSAVPWKMVSTCGGSSVAIKEDGTLWTAGTNSDGILGRGIADESFVSWEFGQVGTDTDWVKVAANNWWYKVALKSDGTLWMWGSSMGWGPYAENYSTVPVQIGTDSDWKDFSIGMWFIAAIKDDGTLWVMGDNDEGQLGDPLLGTGTYNYFVQTTMTDCAKVFCGESDTVVIKTDGTMWGFGRCDSYMLGGYQTFKTPQQMFTHPEETYPGADGWASAALGDSYFVGVKVNGEVWGKGSGKGAVWEGSLFLLGGSIDDYMNEFTLIGTARDWADVVADISAWNSMYLHKTGRVYACGSASYGGLGIPERPKLAEMTLVPLDKKVMSVACGDDTGMAIVADTPPDPMPSLGRGIYAYGEDLDCEYALQQYSGTYYQAHLMERIEIPEGLTLVDCAFGAGAVAFVLSDGKMYGYGHKSDLYLEYSGSGDCGELRVLPGEGWAKIFLAPNLGLYGIKEDKTLWKMAEDYSGPVLLPGANWREVFPGRDGQNYAITDNGDLYALGPNYYSFDTDGLLSCSTPTFVHSGVKKVSVGYINTLVLMEDGTVYGAGANNYHSLAQPVNSSEHLRFFRILEAPLCRDVCAREWTTFYVAEDGIVHFCGYDDITKDSTVTSAPFIQLYTHIGIPIDQLFTCGNATSDQLWMLDFDGAPFTIGRWYYNSTHQPLRRLSPYSGFTKVSVGLNATAIFMHPGGAFTVNFWTNFSGQSEIA